MSRDLLLIVPVVVGHLALFVLAVNVACSFGQNERELVPVKLSWLATLVVVSSALAWWAWSGPDFTWSRPLSAYALICLVMGLVIFPASTLYLHHRPRPRGIAERETELDLAAALGAGTLIGTGRHASLLKLPGNRSLRLRKVEWVVTLPGLPAEMDGLSLLHLSDLHLAPCFDRRFFEAVADEAAAWESDLVLFTGDLVDHEEAVDWVVPTLSRVRGKLGSFAILGNHDLEHEPDRLRRHLAESGFTDLEAGWADVRVRGRTLALGGTSYPWGPPLRLDERPAADFRILLSHGPDLFYWAERAGFDLMLCGHNHGGQIRLPLVGAVFMPSYYSRRFDRGFFRKNGLTMHVSQGIGGMHPVRYGCNPEVGRLVLRSAPAERRDLLHDPASRTHGLGLTRAEESSR